MGGQAEGLNFQRAADTRQLVGGDTYTKPEHRIPPTFSRGEV